MYTYQEIGEKDWHEDYEGNPQEVRDGWIWDLLLRVHFWGLTEDGVEFELSSGHGDGFEEGASRSGEWSSLVEKM